MIPSQAHFIWFGRELPWIHIFAVQTAAMRGGFDRVILHHADDISATAWWEVLEGFPGVETRTLSVRALLEQTGEHGPRLVDIYRSLRKREARANMVRAALLYNQGGVYLDTDTVTVASLAPLRQKESLFCGNERLVFPASLKWYSDPVGYGRALAMTGARDMIRRLPDGWRLFRRIEHLYPTAVNNAVLGAEPGHPFIQDLLERMTEVPRWRRAVRYTLGTALLQQAAADYRGNDLTVLGPSLFYPLGPEISEHWFRPTRQLRLQEALGSEPLVVHWYASVRTRKAVQKANPDWVRAMAGTQLFSALALPLVLQAEELLAKKKA